MTDFPAAPVASSVFPPPLLLSDMTPTARLSAFALFSVTVSCEKVSPSEELPAAAFSAGFPQPDSSTAARTTAAAVLLP